MLWLSYPFPGTVTFFTCLKFKNSGVVNVFACDTSPGVYDVNEIGIWK